ncbi:MAG: hypothetical protein ACJ8F7_05545 [Gemmataceae bacterium]
MNSSPLDWLSAAISGKAGRKPRPTTKPKLTPQLRLESLHSRDMPSVYAPTPPCHPIICCDHVPPPPCTPPSSSCQDHSHDGCSTSGSHAKGSNGCRTNSKGSGSKCNNGSHAKGSNKGSGCKGSSKGSGAKRNNGSHGKGSNKGSGCKGSSKGSGAKCNNGSHGKGSDKGCKTKGSNKGSHGKGSNSCGDRFNCLKQLAGCCTSW